jgi:hypothetical protein
MGSLELTKIPFMLPGSNTQPQPSSTQQIRKALGHILHRSIGKLRLAQITEIRCAKQIQMHGLRGELWGKAHGDFTTQVWGKRCQHAHGKFEILFSTDQQRAAIKHSEGSRRNNRLIHSAKIIVRQCPT